MRYIDNETRQEILSVVHMTQQEESVENILNGIPEANVEPIRHAHWIVEYNPVSHNPMRFVCSCCGEHWTPIDGVVWLRYLGRCPNSICGAILDEDEEVKKGD